MLRRLKHVVTVLENYLTDYQRRELNYIHGSLRCATHGTWQKFSYWLATAIQQPGIDARTLRERQLESSQERIRRLYNHVESQGILDVLIESSRSSRRRLHQDHSSQRHQQLGRHGHQRRHRDTVTTAATRLLNVSANLTHQYREGVGMNYIDTDDSNNHHDHDDDNEIHEGSVPGGQQHPYGDNSDDETDTVVDDYMNPEHLLVDDSDGVAEEDISLSLGIVGGNTPNARNRSSSRNGRGTTTNPNALTGSASDEEYHLTNHHNNNNGLSPEEGSKLANLLFAVSYNTSQQDMEFRWRVALICMIIIFACVSFLRKHHFDPAHATV